MARSKKNPITVAELHRALTQNTIQDRGGESDRDPAMGKGLFFGGLDRVGRHWLGVRNRKGVVQAEAVPAKGQAALWLRDVERVAPLTGMHVAQQIARLCGEDSTVSLPDRSLADAVGIKDAAGHKRAYTERGVQWLSENGWIVKKVTGKGRGATTTYYLSNPDGTEQRKPRSLRSLGN